MRSKLFPLAPLALLLMVAGYVACGDDDDGDGGPNAAEVAAYCDALCDKFVECGISTEEQCQSTCTQTTGGGSCNPSSSEVDACIDAIPGAECSDLQVGNFPAACADLCDEGGGDQDMGADIPGTGTLDTGGSTTDACDDLSACCPGLAAESSEREACEGAVSSELAAACQSVLTTLQSQDFCE